MTKTIADCHDLSSVSNKVELGTPVAAWQDVGMDKGFGERLREAMDNRGMSSQKALAVAAGLDPGAVSRHLQRAKPPNRESVEKYCLALGVMYEWLVRGTGNPNPPKAPPQPFETAPSFIPAHARGLAGLELVLDDYEWPSGLSIEVIDDVIAQARESAETPAGKVRPPSAWRAFLSTHLKAGARRSGQLRKVRA